MQAEAGSSDLSGAEVVSCRPRLLASSSRLLVLCLGLAFKREQRVSPSLAATRNTGTIGMNLNTVYTLGNQFVLRSALGASDEAAAWTSMIKYVTRHILSASKNMWMTKSCTAAHLLNL